MELRNKIVLITGASRGIGKSSAIAFAKEGCSVIINFKSDIKSAQIVLDECNNYSNDNIIIQADISKEDDVIQMLNKIKDKYNKLDILINNAGIFDQNDRLTNIEAFDNIYKNNFLGCVIVTKYALQIMKQGKIVNVSSIHGRLGHGRPGAIAYSSLKAALENYSKNLAKELAPNILVNIVAPGRVITPLWGEVSKEEQIKLGQAHLIKRMIKPEEVSNSIIFLTKNDAMCGEVLTIDGGMSLMISG